MKKVVAALLAVGLCGGVAGAQGVATEIATEARAVLDAHCAKCHGATSNKGGLSLSSTATALEGGNSGPVIDLEAAAKSLLLTRINDAEDGMPPDEKLDGASIDLLTRWVEAGAPLPEPEGGAEEAPLLHGFSREDAALWAFRPVERPTLPKVAEEWAANPIDTFVKAGLDGAGLTPAPVAEKRELLKRLYYDLTGLPPTPEAVAAFVQDARPEAYEEVVDALLSSPQYGEKWARHWLDLVRYADSNGYERDSNKLYIWRYRDYVIRSLNEDKPYDEFVREQLAGDELEEPTPESITATGYYRLGLWDDEPADPLLARYDNLDDIADTTGRVMLGMTIGCARCHNHKIDPVTQEDYYRFLSFFEGVEGMKRSHGNGVLRSIMTKLEQAVQDKAVAEHRAEEARMNDALRETLADFRAKLVAARPELADDEALRVSDLVGLGFQFYRDTWETLPDFDMIRAEDEGALTHGFVSTSPASRQQALGFRFEGTLRVQADGEYRFRVDALDGTRLSVGGDVVYEAVGLGKHDGRARVQLEAGSHPFRLDYFTKDGPPLLRVSWSGPGFRERPLSLQAESESKPLLALFEKHGVAIIGEEAMGDFKRTERLLARHKRDAPEGKMAMAVTEKGPEPGPSHILLRGNAHSPGKEVTPGFPSIFEEADPSLASPYRSEDSSGRRRQLAEWITDPENPLTARVMVNRLWQFHFGRGIVRSSSNFGVVGQRPTHPGLLDWLASEFVAQGWRLKPMHKLMVMSRTYRMSSRNNAAGIEQDPVNNLYWRFDPRRLTGEELRDSLLRLNDTLNSKMFGPGVYPELPEAVLATSSMQDNMWKNSPPDEAARRSIYIHVKRSLREPLLDDFDLPDGDTSCPVRFETTQPTQALGMLNSAFVNEQAALLAARVIEEEGADTEARIARAIALATCRPAEAGEIAQGLRFLDEMRALGENDGDKAFGRFCLLVLNLNEFMYID